MVRLSLPIQNLVSFRVGMFLLTTLVSTSQLHADEPSTKSQQKSATNKADCRALDMLPESIIAFAEVPDLGSFLKTILNHPLRSQVEALPPYKEVVRSGGLAKLQQGIDAFEATMGKPWQESIATLTDGGVTVAIDSSERSVALLVKSSDKEMLDRFRGFLYAIRLMQPGKSGSMEQAEYRGIKAFALNDQTKLAVMDNWLLVTNKSKLAKSIIDRYLDRTKDSLAESKSFAAILKDREALLSKKPTALGYVDVETIRNAGIAKKLYEEKVDNPVLELLLGGVLANLRHTPYATAKFNVTESDMELALATPHDRAWEAPREYYFGESKQVAAPPLINIANRLFAISAHRDLSQMWLRAGDLLTEKANEGIAKADTQLTTFFSGRDFGEDILGSIESDIQIIGKVQDFSNVLPRPAIKLPAFALQFQMKNPEETKRELRRVFQSFIGFLNVIGAMNGQPQFDLDMDSVGNAQLVSATYVPDQDKREAVDAAINFNFSPTIAFLDNRMVLSSTTALARELVGRRETDPVPNPTTNTIAFLQADALKQVLESNKPQLVANNMLEKGHSKEAAEGEIGLLLELIGLLKDASVDLDVTNNQLKLTAKVHVDSVSAN